MTMMESSTKVWASALACALVLSGASGCGFDAPATVDAQPPPTSTASAPTPTVPSTEAPLFERRYDDGVVRFVDRRELPNTFFTVRGAMTVRFFEGYVVVDRAEGALVIPREYLEFVNSSSFD